MTEPPSRATDSPAKVAARAAEDIRSAARRQWAHDPAGALVVAEDELGTPRSFALVEQYRYAEQPWMHEVFGFDRFAGKAVLEIGVGLGTDHLQFARAGALMTGIDLTPRCIELTRTRFEQEGLTSDLRVMDAEHLDFAENSFDAVYSFGVLHHIPSAEHAFAEIRRVLRPGGIFIGAVYNRWSLFAAVTLASRIRNAEWRHESLQERLARIEYSSAAQSPKPYVKLFTSRGLSRGLRAAAFHTVAITQNHFGMKLNRLPPEWMVRLFSSHAGWYLVYHAS